MSRRRLRVVCSSDEEDEELQPPPPPPPPPPQQRRNEETDDIIIDDIETNFETVTINSSNPTPNSNISTTTTNTSRNGSRSHEAIPLDISDDEEENVIINDATTGSSSENENSNYGYFEVSGSPVNGALERLGLRLRREWLDSCLGGLQSSVQGFQGMDASGKARLCFEQFLWSDMNYCGAGVLPPNVHTLHLVDLKGPFVLQVDEIVNISCPLRRRYQSAAPGKHRCLKLSMTDGVQRVFGMEYRPIKALDVLAAAGLKVVVCNVNIRHGLLMLVPEALEVLGGTVDEMEAARQRLVNEINKPPRGKRNRTGAVPPLATRATLAAWPPHNDATPGHVDINTTTPQQARGQESAVRIPANNVHRQAFATPWSRNNTQQNPSAAARPQEHDEVPRHINMPARIHLGVAGQGTASGIPANENPRKDLRVPTFRGNAEPTIPQNIDEHMTEVMTPSGATRPVTQPDIRANHMSEEDVNLQVTRDNPRKDFRVPTIRSNAEPTIPQNIDEHMTEVMTPSGATRPVTQPDSHANHMSAEDVNLRVSRDNPRKDLRVPTFRGNAGPTIPQNIDEHMTEVMTPSGVTRPVTQPDSHANHMSAEDVHLRVSREYAESTASSTTDMDVENIPMGDDLDHHMMLSRDRETPFTYLASLSAKCAAIDNEASAVRGKIKCFVTAVKGFQYKERATYELRLYVDDGSLISEILIDHNVVQNRIGYSPQEVTSAMASSESKRVNEMKKTMKQFQMFLINFEGTMVVEMNKASPVPVAIEMNQGCPASDARLLLQRFKSFNPAQPQNSSHLNPIDLSP